MWVRSTVLVYMKLPHYLWFSYGVGFSKNAKIYFLSGMSFFSKYAEEAGRGSFENGCHHMVMQWGSGGEGSYSQRYLQTKGYYVFHELNVCNFQSCDANNLFWNNVLESFTFVLISATVQKANTIWNTYFQYPF